jgi:hypothetical protein
MDCTEVPETQVEPRIKKRKRKTSEKEGEN